MNTQHNYDGRTITYRGEIYLWGRSGNATDVLRLGDEAEEYLFTLPYRVEDAYDVVWALNGWLDVFDYEELNPRKNSLWKFGSIARYNTNKLQRDMEEIWPEQDLL